MSLRGAKRRSNPMKSSTYEIRDCFAPLAMTTLWTFYESIKIGNEKYFTGFGNWLLFQRHKLLRGKT